MVRISENRECGIDLFRCLGLLFVNGIHMFLYNGFYYEQQQGIAMWAANSFRWLFYGCNGMFMLMTGYLKSEKQWKKGYYKSLLPILVGYVLTCIISYPIRYFLLGEKDSWQVWLQRFITFSNYAWYVEMYIGLLLFSPIINLALNAVTDNRKLYCLAGTMIVLSALPSIFWINGAEGNFSLFPDYWTSLYPLTYYVIGATIRRTKPQIHPATCLLITAGIAMGLGLVSMLTAKDGFQSGFSQGYGGFWITTMVTFLFLGVYRLKLPKKLSGLMAWASGGVLEGFMLSRLLDVWIYGKVSQWHSPSKYPLIFICITIPVFLVSIIAGKAVHTVTVNLTRKK